MRIQAGLEATSLDEQEDFTSLTVVARRADHLWLTREQLLALAGTRANDPDWLAALDSMIAYAGSHGWVDQEGAVRAHVEWT